MESDRATLIKALKIVAKHYRKMLLVNLTDYTYEGVKIPDDEVPFITDNKIINYWNWFCNSGLVHNDDRDKCIKYGANVKFGTHLLYRRKIAEEWHWVIMELTSPEKCDDGNEYCVCCVRDINKIYMPAYEDAIEKIGTTDLMTGLLNKFAFERDREKHKGEKVGIIFADLNGLKWTNDHLGHKAGDDLIRQFAGLLSINFGGYASYHISGDEFVVCAYNQSLREFIIKAIAFHKSMWVAMEHPIASIGYAIGEGGEFNLAYDEAEKEMYDDKRIFYSRFPQFQRK